MSLVGFKGQNHPQQTAKRGALDEVDDRGTPPELFDPLDAVHHFTLDVAAAPHNAKCAEYYTRADDGLAQPWTGSVWCNPPYSSLSAWLEKAWAEWRGVDGRHPDVDLIVMLLPANRPEQKWWQEYVEPFRDQGGPLSVRFLPGRPRFIMPGQTQVLPNQRPPFGLCTLTWSAA
jgi:phage N-6-adenine-methyltransferase